MLSILIPTYNYNIYPLVSEVNRQCLACQIKYEILVLDDFSSDFIIENSEINGFDNVAYFKNEENIGRTATRNTLAEKAQYSWLLFLDADVIPANKDFISQYISFLNPENMVIFGGYQYQSTKPDPSRIFRYKYGKKCEEKAARLRKLNPYQYIFSGNILIQKKLFSETNYPLEGAFYGMDVYLAYQLFIKKTTITHIDNPIYHLGLESNEVFFAKALNAVENRKLFLSDSKEIEKISPLIKHYHFLKKYRLTTIVTFGFKISEPFLKRLILNKKPNLFCFNLYRLGYICSLK